MFSCKCTLGWDVDFLSDSFLDNLFLYCPSHQLPEGRKRPTFTSNSTCLNPSILHFLLISGESFHLEFPDLVNGRSPFPHFYTWMSSSALSSRGVSVPLSVSFSFSESPETFHFLPFSSVSSYFRPIHPVPRIWSVLCLYWRFHKFCLVCKAQVSSTNFCAPRHFWFCEWMPGNLLIHAAAYFNLTLMPACFLRLSYIVDTWKKIFLKHWSFMFQCPLCARWLHFNTGNIANIW